MLLILYEWNKEPYGIKLQVCAIHGQTLICGLGQPLD